jgi:type VI secretion system secreted protein VgrG
VVNIAAARKVVLAVSGGASITIEGGSFTAQCPGKITVRAGVKSMVGPGTQDLVLPQMPKSICVSCLLAARSSGSAFAKE